jgi:hypothetical protein
MRENMWPLIFLWLNQFTKPVSSLTHSGIFFSNCSITFPSFFPLLILLLFVFLVFVAFIFSSPFYFSEKYLSHTTPILPHSNSNKELFIFPGTIIKSILCRMGGGRKGKKEREHSVVSFFFFYHGTDSIIRFSPSWSHLKT